MKLRLVLLGLCLFVLSMTAFAQETAEWGDLGLVVEVPDGWEIDDSGENALLVVYNDDDLAIYFYEPRDARDAEDAIEQLIENNEGTEFEFDDPFETEIMGEEAFRVDYESPGFSGFSLAFEFDGNVLLLDAGIFDDSLSSDQEEELQAIIDTLEEGEGSSNNSNNNSGGGDAIESAADEDASGEDIVEELIELELVSEDGEFLFEEDELEEDTQDFPESYEGGNIAMGGWVSFERAEDDEEYRICGFIAQATTDDMDADEGALFISGIDSDSSYVNFDLDIEDVEGSNFEAFDAGIDAEDMNHILVIISGDEVSTFVNGEEVVSGWELDFSAGDDERFAGYIADLGCTMTNVWAYAFE